jgi:ABC-type multidrug transport system fused ATPase/permease subunit
MQGLPLRGQANCKDWSSSQHSQIAHVPAIVFDHVSFGYKAEEPVLRDFSLAVSPGTIVALVGESGAGKSTAITLLQRLYEPDAGQISFFGHDLREFGTDVLRNFLAVVPQEPSLLMGSIRDNIVYGRLEADEQAIRHAAQQAGIMELNLPRGLETNVGPRGTRLSGGQRQRVAIARALVRAAPVIVLDEATSALDALAEERLQATLEALRRRHTVLLVAHRLSTVRLADMIAVVDNGRVVEVGSHTALLARGGTYARLVQAQLTGGTPKQATLSPHASSVSPLSS